MESTVDASDFNAGRCFGNGGLPTVSKPRPSASRFKPPIPKQGVHIPLHPINNLDRKPERNIFYPSSEKREDATELFENETPMGGAVKTAWDTKDTDKAEKVDLTTEILWEVEWYARGPRVLGVLFNGSIAFSGVSLPQRRTRPGKGTGSYIKRALYSAFFLKTEVNCEHQKRHWLD